MLLVSGCPSYAQVAPPRFKIFQTKDGLELNSVYSIAQGSGGYMWLGSGIGIQRFNGYRFEKWNDGVQPSRAAYDIYEDAEHRIWVSNPGSLYRFQPGSKTYELLTFPAPKNYSYRLEFLKEDQSNIWFYVHNIGFSCYEKESGKLKSLIRFDSVYKHIRNQNQLQSVAVLHNGNFWTINNNDAEPLSINFDGKTLSVKSFQINHWGEIKGMIPVKQGVLVLGTKQTAVCKEGNLDSPLLVLSKNNIPGNHNRWFTYIRTNVKDPNAILFPGNDGIYQFNESTLKLDLYLKSDISENVSRQMVFALSEDANGNIWIGKDVGNGLLLFNPNKSVFKQLNAPPERFSIVYSMCSDPDGNIYAGNFEMGINQFNKEGNWLRHFEIPFTELNQPISPRSIHYVGKNCLLIKSLTGKLFLLHTKSGKVDDITPILPLSTLLNPVSFDGNIEAVSENKWLITKGQHLISLEEKKGKFIATIVKEIKSEFPLSIVRHKDSSIYVSTINKLYVLQGTRFDSIPLPRSCHIKDLHFAKNGTMWLATTSGIDLFAGGKYQKTLSTATGLLNDYVYGILEDSSGRHWFSTNRGLGSIDNNNTIHFYSEEDGVQGEEFDTQSFCYGANNELYFGGVKGITGFDPSKLLNQKRKTAIMITSVTINGQDHPFKLTGNTLSLELDYHQTNIGIELSLTDFANTSGNRFVYKIDNMGIDWVQLNQTHFIQTSLQPGTYRFIIKGSSDGASWTPEFIATIVIHQAWWKTNLFIGFIILLVIIGIALLFRFFSNRRIERKMQELKTLNEIQKERERIGRDLHDNIGAYTTSLLANIDAIEKKLPEKTSLQPLKEDAQEILRTVRETIWILKNESRPLEDFIDSYKMYVNKMIQHLPFIMFECTENVEGSMDLSPVQCLHLNRILQELVQNTLKHSNATAIYTSFHLKEHFSFTYYDNGITYNLEQVTKGDGLNNIEYRANEINFSIQTEEADGHLIWTFKQL
ncbi:MAG: hypothetical protein K2P88_01865 [Chitinophagaceae bacterium]|nr:hypothetical protein [Chitinophagaceae bacterium]